jgi:hypothetical protein
LHALLLLEWRVLDTITYLPDLSVHDDPPTVSSDMIKIVNEFIIVVARDYDFMFESFEENNSSTAAVKVFLLSSLASPIRTFFKR